MKSDVTSARVKTTSMSMQETSRWYEIKFYNFHSFTLDGGPCSSILWL